MLYHIRSPTSIKSLGNIMRTMSSTMTEESKKLKIMIFGGNGFVGQAIVNAALAKGIDVLSVSRSGAPPNYQSSLKARSAVVQWLKGDIFQPDSYKESMKSVDAVVSCVGAFGSNEFMEKMNGDANITAIRVAKELDVPRFIYISTVENNLPSFFLKGYFNGKRRSEKALAEAFPLTGAVLRPGFIYGTRDITFGGKTVGIPLWLLGQPLSVITNNKLVRCLRESLPGMKALLATPISRDDLGIVAIEAALGKIEINSDRIITTDQLIEEVSRLQR